MYYIVGVGDIYLWPKKILWLIRLVIRRWNWWKIIQFLITKQPYLFIVSDEENDETIVLIFLKLQFFAFTQIIRVLVQKMNEKNEWGTNNKEQLDSLVYWFRSCVYWVVYCIWCTLCCTFFFLPVFNSIWTLNTLRTYCFKAKIYFREQLRIFFSFFHSFESYFYRSSRGSYVIYIYHLLNVFLCAFFVMFFLFKFFVVAWCFSEPPTIIIYAWWDIICENKTRAIVKSIRKYCYTN